MLKWCNEFECIAECYNFVVIKKKLQHFKMVKASESLDSEGGKLKLIIDLFFIML